MRVLDIIHGTTVDGPGLRTSIYFAGCTHDCPGCHNPQSHDPMGGREMSVDEILAEIDAEGFDVTFSGGDPLMQYKELIPLARAVRQRGLGIWCYTGYLYEDICRNAELRPLLDEIDVLVDGPFIEKRRNLHIRFRGSDNQRLIVTAKSRPGSVEVYVDND